MKNKSGIYPAGNRVLVFVDQIKEQTKDSLIELLPDTIEAADFTVSRPQKWTCGAM